MGILFADDYKSYLVLALEWKTFKKANGVPINKKNDGKNTSD